jgi:hypothetical protein
MPQGNSDLENHMEVTLYFCSDREELVMPPPTSRRTRKCCRVFERREKQSYLENDTHGYIRGEVE